MLSGSQVVLQKSVCPSVGNLRVQNPAMPYLGQGVQKSKIVHDLRMGGIILLSSLSVRAMLVNCGPL